MNNRWVTETRVPALFKILAEENAPVKAYRHELNLEETAAELDGDGQNLIEYLAAKNAPAALAEIQDVDNFARATRQEGVLPALRIAQEKGTSQSFVALMDQTKFKLAHARTLIDENKWNYASVTGEVFGAVIKPFIEAGNLSLEDHKRANKFINMSELETFVDDEAVSVARQLINPPPKVSSRLSPRP